MAKKILITDDDPQVQTLLKVFLEKQGYQPIIAADGRSCLLALTTSAPDLVLLDVNMPGIDGFDVLSTIEQMRKLTRLPVILITATGGKRNVLKAASLGVQDFIVKPFDLQELAQRIEMHLFRLEPSDLQRLVRELHPFEADVSFKQEIRRFIDSGWKPFSATLQGRPLCVLFRSAPQYQTPESFPSDLHATGLMVFAKFSKRWKCIWPFDATGILDLMAG